MGYIIYWLVGEKQNKTYIGLTDNLSRRLKEHKNKKVKSTKVFGKFDCYVLELDIKNEVLAREREKYWKSTSGRRELKKLFIKIKK